MRSDGNMSMEIELGLQYPVAQAPGTCPLRIETLNLASIDLMKRVQGNLWRTFRRW